MFSYVFMKFLESLPDKYDTGISILTYGKLRIIQEEITSNYVNPGDHVLEIGCGTGELAIILAKKKAKVVGIDISPEMLSVAKVKIADEGLENDIEIVELNAIDIDHKFEDNRFDVITSTLTLSELTDDEVDYILKECARVLKKNGTLMVADEVVPRNMLAKILYYIYRLPSVIVTYILARTTTNPISRFEERITKVGLEILNVKSYLFDSMRLIIAKKP
jgi:ubiquinone/menaquinone biosynthesis C-methylase UbiE